MIPLERERGEWTQNRVIITLLWWPLPLPIWGYPLHCSSCKKNMDFLFKEENQQCYHLWHQADSEGTLGWCKVLSIISYQGSIQAGIRLTERKVVLPSPFLTISLLCNVELKEEYCISSVQCINNETPISQLPLTNKGKGL